MIKYLYLIFLPLFLLAENEMKCAPGKCSGGQSSTKNISNLKKPSMKCEAGKCSSGKEMPKKEHLTSVSSKDKNEMKCQAGKCSGSKETLKNSSAKKDKPATVEQLFNVRVTKVKSITTAKEQVNYGYIKAKDSATVDVTAWFEGFVEELYADTLYKKVNKDEPLVKVYSSEAYKAKQDYINSLNYNKKNPMPQMLKSAKIKLELLNINKKEIKAIENRQTMSKFTTIYSPTSGWIFKKSINQGSAFSAKQKLFQIVNLDEVWAEVKLFQEQLQNLEMLKEFRVEAKGINKSFKAQKLLLYPKTEPNEATFTLRLNVKNTNELLKPGMYIKVYAKAKSKTRLVIPTTAAIRKNGKWYAFLATDFIGEYEPIEIEINQLNNEYYEVTKGLKEGDTLVENALFMMDSDAQINSIY
jgi:Cu(I)/Ag(I) efflux system membrane fusion protein